MRISDWSSDVCSSDLAFGDGRHRRRQVGHDDRARELAGGIGRDMRQHRAVAQMDVPVVGAAEGQAGGHDIFPLPLRSEGRRVGKGVVRTWRDWWGPVY